MDFRSDNVGVCAPQILDAIIRANEGTVAPYGRDAYSALLTEKFSELFEQNVDVFPVFSGTAANALAIASTSVPWGAIYCHQTAHILNTECNAPEFFSGGAKLVPLAGEGYRIDIENLTAALKSAGIGITNKAQPCAISITQPTDYGTVYSLAHTRALADVARSFGLRVHMDGARLANAMQYLECSAAEATWKSGVDILSFGATKNGAMNVDAIVVFDRSLSKELAFRCRRGGHVSSKMRFASVQLSAYVENGLWLELAAKANAAASALATGLADIPGVELIAPVNINIVLLRLPESVIAELERMGFLFYRRGKGRIRLVCRFDTSRVEIEKLLDALAHLTTDATHEHDL